MRRLADMEYQEGVERIKLLMQRAVLHRETEHEVLSRLGRYLDALNAGDMLLAVSEYHALCAALLATPARRVSGDLFKDYLLYLIIERDDAFSRMAAANSKDEALMSLMKQELDVFGALSTLDGPTLVRYGMERYRELKVKPRQARDNISVMSSAVWSGAQVRQGAREDDKPAVYLPSIREDDWASLRYGDMELRDSYVSDEALEEIYARMLETPDWRGLAEDIWNFFASYGSGIYMMSQSFTVRDGSVVKAPMPPEAVYMQSVEFQNNRLLSNAIRFMRDESYSAMLITGDMDTGKTALATSLIYELPELRIVSVPVSEYASLSQVMESLSGQPLKFLMLFDCAELRNAALRNAVSRMSEDGGNMLPLAVCRNGQTDPLFPLRVELPYMQLSQFIELVGELARAMGKEPDDTEVRRACVDHQVDHRERLTYSGARLIAQNI